MKKGTIGIQISTIKSTIAERGVYDTLQACADLGYHCVEVSQLPMTAENVDSLRRASRDFGINIAANSASPVSYTHLDVYKRQLGAASKAV